MSVLVSSMRSASTCKRLSLTRFYFLHLALDHLVASIFRSCTRRLPLGLLTDSLNRLVDVNSPLEGDSINRADPESSYNTAYLNRTFAVIEAFRNYPNLIGFFSGNEIINDQPTSRVDPPYIRVRPLL